MHQRPVHDISSNRPGGSSIESLKKRLCLPQVGGIEPFGEPVINRLQHSLCASDTDMITQQPGEACGGTQFQGQRALPARPVERLAEMVLGCGHCSGFGLQEQKLAPDAQQLGKQPACPCTLGLFHCLRGGGKPLGDLPGASKIYRQRVEEHHRSHRSAGFVETAVQLP